MDLPTFNSEELNMNITNITQNGLNKQAVKYLSERGISKEQALEFGHRSVNKEQGKHLIGQEISGLAIAYYDVNKKLVGYRIRPFKSDWDDCPKLKEYYLEKRGELPKFLSKPKKIDSDNLSDQRVNKAYFSQAIDWHDVMRRTSIDVLITEGELKAEAACLAGIPTIALAGVNCFVNKIYLGENDEPKKEFLKELEWKAKDKEFRKNYWKDKRVGLCFDSDIVHKEPVKLALLSLADKMKALGAEVFIVLLPTEADGEKNGIDDFLVRHGGDAFKALVRQFATLQSNPRHSILKWDADEKKHSIKSLEPIVSIKGIMSWTTLQDEFAYREGFGWYQWSGKHWGTCSESRIYNKIQKLRYENAWLDLSDKSVFADIKAAIAVEEHDWNPHHIIAFENGYLDTETGKLTKTFDKNLRVTSILPFNYNLKATCPEWLQFLEQALGGNQDLIEYARAWFRWILSPKTKNYPIEATLWLTGAQGTGKGTFLSVLGALIGDDNCATLEPNLMNDPTHLFSLVDKKLSLNSDATGYIQNVGIYNKICSNEPISIKKLYEDRTNARLNTVTVFAMNKNLGFASTGSEGLSRRLHILPFNVKPEVRDPYLKDRLATELEGIFAWAWGLSFSQTFEVLQWRVEKEIRNVYQGQITEVLFLQDRYPTGITQIFGSDLYADYTEWCQANGYKPLNSQNFYLSLKRVEQVKKWRSKGGSNYSIPPMEDYTDPELETKVFTPTEIIYGKEEPISTTEPDSSLIEASPSPTEEPKQEQPKPETTEQPKPSPQPKKTPPEPQPETKREPDPFDNPFPQESTIVPQESTSISEQLAEAEMADQEIEFDELCKRTSQMLRALGHKTKEGRKEWFEIFFRRPIQNFLTLSSTDMVKAYCYLCDRTKMFTYTTQETEDDTQTELDF